jgi:CheY-like chemotaxis protein
MPILTRILLVEDSVRDAEMVLNAFEECGLAQKVVHLRDGVEALDYLYRRGQFAEVPEGNPSVVLMDIKMPRVDGLEVLRQMKADPRLQMIPVMLITSSREDRDLVEGYKLGANSYAVKSVNFQEFVEKVKRLGEFWAFVNEPPPGGKRYLDDLTT